jgi:uncharacterized protein (TIGR02588 family)
MPKRESIAGKTPPLEWIAAAIGLLLILSLVTVIGREAIREQAAESPVITIRVGVIRPAAVGYVVPFEAVNQANGTAVGVEIEGTLTAGPSLFERSGATIDYVPGHGRASGGLFFTHDPRGSELLLRATGYQDP